MQNLLITGVDGFTGFYLKKLLKKEFNIIDSKNINICNFKKIEEILNSVKDNLNIIHLAAISSVDHDNVSEIYETNIVGTRNILEAAKLNNIKVKKVIIASSANIYGNQSGILGEDSELIPENDYAVSKYAVEALCRTYLKFLDITLVRPFNYSGVGQSSKFIIPKIVNAFRERKKSLEMGNVEIIRDFSDVRDIVDYYRQILVHDKNPLIVNLCSGTGTSLKKIIDHCSFLTGHEMKITVNQKFIRENEIMNLIPTYKPCTCTLILLYNCIIFLYTNIIISI